MRIDTCFYSAHSARLIYIYGELECTLYAGKKHGNGDNDHVMEMEFNYEAVSVF